MQDTAASRLRRFSKYVLVGLFTNGSIYLLFLGMIWVGLHPIAASGLCYAIGVAASYLLNRRWTFQSTSTHTRDMIRFAIAYGVGLLVTLLSMFLLLKVLTPALAQLVTIGVTAVAIYSALELLRFGR